MSSPHAVLGRDVDSKNHWSEIGAEYTSAIENEYHTHRLQVIRRLIPTELFAPRKRIFDFGCGDAVLFPPFLNAGAHIEGIDVAPEMIEFAKRRLASISGNAPSLVSIAGVAAMRDLASDSFDAVLSYNVLAYLTDEEEETFYTEARRIVRRGGFLSVTHSNSLFDLYSLNRYTAEFVGAISGDEYLGRIPALLTASDHPTTRSVYNVRENPLAYAHKLARYGFREVQQEFINLHDAPPLLLEGRNYPNTLDWPEPERWKLMLKCSTYGSTAVRQ